MTELTGIFVLKCVATQRVLDTDSQNKIFTSDYNKDSDTQKWEIKEDGGDEYFLKNVGTGKYLDSN